MDSALDRLLIGEAMAQLSSEHRAVVRRSYYQRWTTAPIAADLGIAEGTVKSRLRYALRALRLTLQEIRKWGDAMTMFGVLSLSGGGTHEYAMWDAAYVLGSLSSVERLAYEAHLSFCPSCRGAVSELGGMPALLAQLDREFVASIDEGGNAWAVTPPLRPELWASLLAR